MTTRTPPPRTNTLHSAAGVTLAATEATALSAGDTVVYQNTGNTVLRVVATVAGTGSVQGIGGAANQPVTLAIGDNLIGPLDPALYGTTVTVTTATAVGTVGTYIMAARFRNAAGNPFETVATAPDSN